MKPQAVGDWIDWLPMINSVKRKKKTACKDPPIGVASAHDDDFARAEVRGEMVDPWQVARTIFKKVPQVRTEREIYGALVNPFDRVRVNIHDLLWDARVLHTSAEIDPNDWQEIETALRTRIRLRALRREHARKIVSSVLVLLSFGLIKSAVAFDLAPFSSVPLSWLGSIFLVWIYAFWAAWYLWKAMEAHTTLERIQTEFRAGVSQKREVLRLESKVVILPLHASGTVRGALRSHRTGRTRHPAGPDGHPGASI